MKLKKVAESILRDLNSLENRSNTIQKMAHSYREKQIEIVVNHLRHLIVVDKPGEIGNAAWRLHVA